MGGGSLLFRPSAAGADDSSIHAVTTPPRHLLLSNRPECLVRVNGRVARCSVLPSKTGDPNIEETVRLVECSLPRSAAGSPTLRLAVGDHQVGANFSMITTMDHVASLNAFPGFRFRRPGLQLLQSTKRDGMSVCIKTVTSYSPFIRDVVAYYKDQGIRHVYIGLMTKAAMAAPPTAAPTASTGQPSLLEQYENLLAPDYEEFVSFGVVDNDHVEFKKGKMPFIQSVLLHAKSYDRLLAVHDVDEVFVPMMGGVAEMVAVAATATRRGRR